MDDVARRDDNWIERLWYSGSRWYLLLMPLALLFAAATAMRRSCYRRGWLATHTMPVPVVVVGNVTVGGTGKTPVTIWLARQLRERGFTPGVVSRGYGGVVGDTPMQANANGDPEIVGDEPIMLAARSRCPVVVHPDRIAGARELTAMGVDVIIADDGLQHYRLARDFEIAVVDGARAFGNGRLLPAGPLREAPSRLERVDRVLLQQASRDAEWPASLPALPPQTNGFHLVAHELISVDGSETADFAAFRERKVHAVAAIGNPERFFTMLESRGLEIERHAFPDHAMLGEEDIAYDDDAVIVMTEKDAVKCRGFATGRHWYVPVDVDMHDVEWLHELQQRLEALRS